MPYHGASAQARSRASVERAVAAGGLAPGARLPSVRHARDRSGRVTHDGRRRPGGPAPPRRGRLPPPQRAPGWPSVRRCVRAAPRAGARGHARPRTRQPRPGPAARAGPPCARSPADGCYGEPPVDCPSSPTLARGAFVADGVAAERVAVVNGALDGIERVLAAQLSPGDLVAVEDPGWPGVLDLARALGLRLAPVAVDERGMRPEALAAALRAGARGGDHHAARAQPVRRGAGRRPRRRAARAARGRARGRGRPPRPGRRRAVALGGGRERRAGRSCARCPSGSARTCAARSSPGDELTLARVEGRLSLGPGWVSGILQRLTARLWADPDVAASVRQAADVYAARRAALVEALAAHGLAAHGRSGMNVWVPVPDEDAAVRALLAHGVSVAAGAPFRLWRPARRSASRPRRCAPPRLHAWRPRWPQRSTHRAAPAPREAFATDQHSTTPRPRTYRPAS